MEATEKLCESWKLSIEKESWKTDAGVQFGRNAIKSCFGVINDLQVVDTEFLLILYFFEEFLFHERMRLFLSIYSRTEEMNNFCIAKHRIDYFNSVQVVECLTDLAVPFARQFLHWKSEQTIRLVE